MTTAYNQPTYLNHTRIVNIPSALIGLVIGKEGRNTKEIQRNCNASITTNTNSTHRTNNEVLLHFITINGTRPSIISATENILNRINCKFYQNGTCKNRQICRFHHNQHIEIIGIPKNVTVNKLHENHSSYHTNQQSKILNPNRWPTSMLQPDQLLKRGLRIQNSKL